MKEELKEYQFMEKTFETQVCYNIIILDSLIAVNLLWSVALIIMISV